MITKSEAGSGKSYVVLQGKVLDGPLAPTIMVEGLGSDGKGVTATINPNDASSDCENLVAWLRECQTPLRSFNPALGKVTPMQGRVREGSGTINIQVMSEPGCQRSYGTSFRVSANKYAGLADFIRKEITGGSREAGVAVATEEAPKRRGAGRASAAADAVDALRGAIYETRALQETAVVELDAARDIMTNFLKQVGIYLAEEVVADLNSVKNGIERALEVLTK